MIPKPSLGLLEALLSDPDNPGRLSALATTLYWKTLAERQINKQEAVRNLPNEND